MMAAAFYPSTWLALAKPAVVEAKKDNVHQVEEIIEVEEDDEVAQQLLKERRMLRERNRLLKATLLEVGRKMDERPPIWVADEDRQACASCNVAFTIFNRRHHCRACGDIFDAACSSKQMVLPFSRALGPQRVCDSCFTGDRAMDSAKAELECSALIALGFGDLATLDESIMLIESPVKKTKKTVTRKITTTTGSCPIPAIGKNGKVRSEIPPPPPFPSVMPKLISSASIPTNLPTAGNKKRFVPPATNMKRLDMAELQQGISRLRKAPVTPLKTDVKRDDALSTLRSSLRRRRKSLEDSFVSVQPASVDGSQSEDQENVNNNSVLDVAPSAKRSVLIDCLRETVAFKDSPISTNPHNSLNSSWIE